VTFGGHDLDELGKTCYYDWFVSSEVLSGQKNLLSIIGGRPGLDHPSKIDEISQKKVLTSISLTVRRCRVYKYLCFRKEPHETCSVCKVVKKII